MLIKALCPLKRTISKKNSEKQLNKNINMPKETVQRVSSKIIIKEYIHSVIIIILNYKYIQGENCYII